MKTLTTIALVLLSLTLAVLTLLILFVAGESVWSYIQQEPTELWPQEGWLIFAGFALMVALLPGVASWKLTRISMSRFR